MIKTNQENRKCSGQKTKSNRQRTKYQLKRQMTINTKDNILEKKTKDNDKGLSADWETIHKRQKTNLPIQLHQELKMSKMQKVQLFMYLGIS